MTQPPTAPRGVAAPPQREIHVRDLAATVRRHWRFVVLLSIVVAAGAWFSSRRAIPQYQSRLTIQINSPKQVFARLDDIDVDEFALKTDPILSEALVLTTQGLALRVVHALDLQLDMLDQSLRRGDFFGDVLVDSLAPPATYELLLRGPAGYEIRDVATGDLVAAGAYTEPAAGPGFLLRVRPTDEADRVVGFRISTPEEAAAWVRAGLSYGVRDGTNAVDIYFTGTDPLLVPRILNDAAVQLRADGAQRARGIAARKREYIGDQLERSQVTFENKLRELQGFKERQNIADLTAEQQSVLQGLGQLELQRQELLVQLAAVRGAMDEATSVGIERLNRLSAIENLGDNAALGFHVQSLLDLYEERRQLTSGTMGLREANPQVAAIDERIEAAHDALRNAVQATERQLAARLRAVETKVNEERAKMRQFPGMETRIAQLQLEASIQEQTTRYLLGQYESARMQEATIAPYVTILDGASPAYRIGTSVRQRAILGLLVGLILGLMGAFFLEYLDQTIKSAHDVERLLGVPVLGLIPYDPKLAAANGRRAPITVVTALGADEPVAEAFRALRTNVTFVGAEKPLQLITVTSPGPGEGKSTTAANLAVTLAQSGQKTILVDADLRRPLVHRAFAIVQDPGLTDILVHRAEVREAVRPDVSPKLDVLPAGVSPPNPSELLGSDAMQQLMAELRREYDYIILDTPPVLPVTDATVVAAGADAVIVTIRSGETEETAAQRALEQLRRVNARIAGVVLNGISSAKDHYYTYYSYQRNVPYPSRRSFRRMRNKVLDWL